MHNHLCTHSHNLAPNPSLSTQFFFLRTTSYVQHRTYNVLRTTSSNSCGQPPARKVSHLSGLTISSVKISSYFSVIPTSSILCSVFCQVSSARHSVGHRAPSSFSSSLLRFFFPSLVSAFFLHSFYIPSYVVVLSWRSPRIPEDCAGDSRIGFSGNDFDLQQWARTRKVRVKWGKKGRKIEYQVSPVFCLVFWQGPGILPVNSAIYEVSECPRILYFFYFFCPFWRRCQRFSAARADYICDLHLRSSSAILVSLAAILRSDLRQRSSTTMFQSDLDRYGETGAPEAQRQWRKDNGVKTMA